MSNVLNQPLCNRLAKRFWERLRKGEPRNAVLKELMHQLYAQGFAAGERAAVTKQEES